MGKIKSKKIVTRNGKIIIKRSKKKEKFLLYLVVGFIIFLISFTIVFILAVVDII